MYNMKMNDYIEPKKLRAFIKELRLNQEDLTAASGVSQAQVSRLIAGKFKKPGMAYNNLCIFVSKAISSKSNNESTNGKIILDAVNEVWDGSVEQADILASVIRSLGPLCAKEH